MRFLSFFPAFGEGRRQASTTYDGLDAPAERPHDRVQLADRGCQRLDQPDSIDRCDSSSGAVLCCVPHAIVDLIHALLAQLVSGFEERETVSERTHAETRLEIVRLQHC
eukprot:1343647-Rhodomonas_salina.1